MVERILGIPCAGLWLAHIDSDFVLNEYGMPKKFPDGMFHIKENPIEKVTIHKMPYRRNEIKMMLEDRRKAIAASTAAIALYHCERLTVKSYYSLVTLQEQERQELHCGQVH